MTAYVQVCCICTSGLLQKYSSDNGAGMLSPDYGMTNFLKFKCVPWMWQILHIFLFIACFYSAATTCVNKGCTKDPSMVEVHGSHYARPSLYSILQCCNCEFTLQQSQYAQPTSKIIIKNCILITCVYKYICIHKILKIKRYYLPVHH